MPMEYQEWNEALGNYFFNETKSEREVYLYITEQEIAQIGKEHGLSGSNTDIFQKYINALKNDFQIPFKLSMVRRPRRLFSEWNQKADRENEIPYYLGYLVAYILPLTVPGERDYNYNNYYGRVNDYFKKFELIPEDKKIKTQNFSKLDHLWEDLERWTWIDKNLEVGIFKLHPFKNKNWVHVGKPLSQTIFPVSAINKLHDFYDYLNFVPGEELTAKIIREKIALYGKKYLSLNSKTINLITDKNNELGQAIVDLIKKNYQNWNGHTASTSANTTSKSSSTIAEFRLCFEEFDPLNPKLNYYFRLFSKVDYPDNLIFSDKYKIVLQTQGWSKRIDLPFDNRFELVDKINNWKGRFPERDIRLFIKGTVYNLSGWIEVKKVYRSAHMKALVKDNLSNEFEKWRTAFKADNFKKLNFADGIKGYILYQFRNPQASHPSLPLLDFESDIKIELIGGLKLKPFTYLGSHLPNIFLEKGSGEETVKVESTNGISKKLERKESELPIWEIPESYSYEDRIFLSTDESEENVEIKVVEAEEFSDPIHNYPKTSIDNYGNTIILSSEKASNIKTKLDREDISTLRHSFKPLRSKSQNDVLDPKTSNRAKNALLNFITYKKQLKISSFFDAFEEVLNKHFPQEYLEDINEGKKLLMRLSLRNYYNLGYLEIDYPKKIIAANPPKLILIPTSEGRKALLTGGRSNALLNRIEREAAKLRLQVNYTKSSSSRPEFLLPDRVTIIASEIHDEQRRLKRLAQNCNLQYDPDEMLQLKLVKKCASIDEYFNALHPLKNFNDEGYTAKKFNSQALKFKNLETNEVEKRLSLVKYKINNYEFKNILWFEEKPYEVILDWGRYFILSKEDKQVIFRDKTDHNTGIFFVPSPLPQLLEKAIVLLSGKIPLEQFLEIRECASYFKIYKNVPLILADKLFGKLNQPVLSKKN